MSQRDPDWIEFISTLRDDESRLRAVLGAVFVIHRFRESSLDATNPPTAVQQRLAEDAYATLMSAAPRLNWPESGPSGADIEDFIERVVPMCSRSIAERYRALVPLAQQHNVDLGPFIAKAKALEDGADGMLEQSATTLVEGMQKARAALNTYIVSGAPADVAAEVAINRLEAKVQEALNASGASPPGAGPAVDYIDLDQAAALVNRSKKTLERYLEREEMPQPDIEGGGGKKHEWKYLRLKPWLESEFGRILPDRPPHAIR